MDTDSCRARARATLLNVMAKRMQHCCSHLWTKERLDDVEDDASWKSNFVQQLPSWYNMVAKRVQYVGFSNVGWSCTNMFSGPLTFGQALTARNVIEDGAKKKLYPSKPPHSVSITSPPVPGYFLRICYDEMVYEMNHIWTADMKSREAMIFAVMNAIFFSLGHGFKPRWSPEFFRLLYAIVNIAFITAKIIASLDEDMLCWLWWWCYNRIWTSFPLLVLWTPCLCCSWQRNSADG